MKPNKKSRQLREQPANQGNLRLDSTERESYNIHGGKLYEKFITLFLCVVLSLSFTACGKGNSNDVNTNSSQQTTDADQHNDTESTIETSSKGSKNVETEYIETEYVETYSIYAEEGAVVTWFDSKTGEFSYKAKCETCGKTESGSHNGLKGGHNTTYSSSYTCQNSQCRMWGKSQPVKIGCKVNGEWVEVTK